MSVLFTAFNLPPLVFTHPLRVLGDALWCEVKILFYSFQSHSNSSSYARVHTYQYFFNPRFERRCEQSAASHSQILRRTRPVCPGNTPSLGEVCNREVQYLIFRVLDNALRGLQPPCSYHSFASTFSLMPNLGLRLLAPLTKSSEI